MLFFWIIYAFIDDKTLFILCDANITLLLNIHREHILDLDSCLAFFRYFVPLIIS